MEKYACWTGSFASEVMNTEALQVADDVFLATHQPQVVRVEKSDVKGTFRVAKGTNIDEQELLQLLLSPDEDHVQIAVVGAAGSGKSHLVRWLYLNIPRSDRYEVVLIPKSANLQQVIEAFIEGRQGEIYERIRTELKKARIREADDSEIRDRLLNEFCVLIASGSPSKDSRVSDEERDIREILTSYLPDLLYDPEFRKSFFSHAPTMDVLVQHIKGTSQRERMDYRHEFTDTDFDVKGFGLQSNHLSKPARVMFEQLVNNPGMKGHVATWMTRNLDGAVAGLFGLGSVDLQQILNDIRQELRTEGKELILLIEDFAKTLGIDRQILAAVSVRPKAETIVRGKEKRGHNELAVLRSVLASTRDYYLSLDETILQRTAVIVDMEVNYSAESVQDNSSAIVDFAARYLNAIRLGTDRSRQWYDEYRKSEVGVWCACDDCRYADDCMRDFGCVNGIGLYPFNEMTLQRMYRTVDPDERRRFNPRDLINKVLQKVLYLDTDIVHGRFPPQILLDDFGGTDLPAWLMEKLRAGFPAEFGRYTTLLTFWRKSGSGHEVAKGIYEAFGLPPLDIPTDSTTGTTVQPPEPDDPKKEALSRMNQDIKVLDKWASDAAYRLPDSLVDRMRESIFGYVGKYIDWNYEMLAEDFYVGTGGKCFRMESITFRKQLRETGRAPVLIELPMQEQPTERDYLHVALALQGMLQYEHYRHWSFERGSTLLRRFMELLEAASVEVLRQIKKLNTENQLWDPVPAIAELLFIGSYFTGKVPVEEPDIENAVSMMFALKTWKEPNLGDKDFRSREWNALVDRFRKCTRIDETDSIIDILLARIACSKGKDEKQFINASEIVRPLTGMMQAWRPKTHIPVDVRVQYKKVRELRQYLEHNLEGAILLEKRSLLQSCIGIMSSVSGQPSSEDLTEDRIIELMRGVTMAEVNSAVTALLSAAFGAGAVARPDIDAIDAMQRRIGDIDLEPLIACIVKLITVDDPYRCLPYVCDDDIVQRIKLLANYLTSVHTLVTELTSSIENQFEGEGDPEEIRSAINDRLQEINSMLGALR